MPRPRATPILIPEQTAPSTPPSGWGYVYFKSDGKPYALNDSGVEVDLTASGGGGVAEVSVATDQPVGTEVLWYDTDAPVLGGSPSLNVQTFATVGGFTWTKPAGAVTTRVQLVAGGGGGGSGRRGANGTIRCGGGGGGGAGYSENTFLAADLAATVAVIVGVGGAGGAARTANDTDGATGAAGGNSSFGTLLSAFGGTGGLGGTAVDGDNGSGGQGVFQGNNGGDASTTGGNGNAPPNPPGGCRATGGGAGGGVSPTTNLGFSGGPGGFVHSRGSIQAAYGTPNPAGANNHGQSDSKPAGVMFFVGGGGGGAGSNPAATGGTGGDGVQGGSGGGGGGASINGGNSGAGGKGGNGYVIVTTWCSD